MESDPRMTGVPQPVPGHAEGAERPLEIVVVGMSWRTAPTEFRDRFLIAEDREEGLLARILSNPATSEALAISTCNRIEIWMASRDVEESAAAALAAWGELCGAQGAWRERTFLRAGREAVVHAFEVAAALDSLVMGETQISSQVKASFARARARGQARFLLGRLQQAALGAAKKVRSSTALGEGAVSVASAAVELSRKILGDVSRRTVAIVGAGEMAELALRHFAKAGATRFRFFNRTAANAYRLSDICPGDVHGLDEMPARLSGCDVVVAATGAPHFVIGPALVRQVMEGRRDPLFLVDIAAPRDIDPAVGRISDVFLYGIDDLEGVVEENRARRRGELDAARRILERAAAKFEDWIASLRVVPTIVDLRRHVHALMARDVERFLPRLEQARGRGDYRQLLDEIADSLANKFLHAPTARARQAAAEGREDEAAAAIRELFGLEEKADGADQEHSEPISRARDAG